MPLETKIVKSKEFYDRIALQYDDGWWYSNPDSKHVKLLMKNILQLNISKNSKILDAGCGTCDTEFFLAEKKCEIIGLDISSNMLKISSEKINKLKIDGISLVKGNVEDLPFKNDYFDYVISEFTLNYVERPFDAFKEITRVLKKNGKIILILSNRKPAYILIWEMFTRNLDFIRMIQQDCGYISFPKEKIKTHFKRYALKEVNKIISKLPIKPLKIIGTHSISGFLGYPILLFSLYANNLKNPKNDIKDINHFVKLKGGKIIFNIFRLGEKIDPYFPTIGRDIIIIGKKI